MPEFGFDSQQWDHIALVAQLLGCRQLIEKYRDHLANPDNHMRARDPQACLNELLPREQSLATKVRASEIMLKLKGKTVPDYQAYRNAWGRPSHATEETRREVSVSGASAKSNP